MTSTALNSTFRERIAAPRALNSEGRVPADLVMASGSGLDPHITPEAAHYQAGRVAEARGLPIEDVEELVDRLTRGRSLGFLGMPRINVLAINLELDRMSHE